jgi:integrase
MPKKPPSYLVHAPSGRARVRIDGKDMYLGPYGSDESYREYARVVAEWHASRSVSQVDHLTVDSLAILYMDFAEKHYRKNGEATSELSLVRLALRHLLRLYGTTLVSAFSPRKLKAVRRRMIDADYCRTSINRHIGRVRRMCKWGVAEELVPVTVYQSLLSVTGLQAGRTDAKESDPVKPVSLRHVAAVQPFVSRQVWAMIRLELRTGSRPGEIRNIRSGDIQMVGPVWEYRFVSHKTAHHGKQRIVYIGPKAQRILKPFLVKAPDEFLFSPTDAKAEFNESRRKNRKTPMTPSQRRRRSKANPKRKPGTQYSKYSFGQAITKACEKADIPHWTPNQLRHTAATRIRQLYGVEIARIILGHSNLSTTELYAEQNRQQALDAMLEMG